MTNGPDDQDPPPPPPPSGGRGLFSRQDPGPPGGSEPPDLPPRRVDSRPRQATPPPGDDNPFLLPNERDRMPVYGGRQLPAIPLALMVLAIVVGGVLFYMSQEDSEGSGGGISRQEASSGLVLHLNGLDMTEAAFRREIQKGIANGRVPCNVLATQPADNIAAGLRLGALRMEVPDTSGVAVKRDQKADDASLLRAANIVKEACPAPAPGAAPAQPGQPVPGATLPPGQAIPGAPPPAGSPGPGAQPPGQPVPGSGSPAPAGTPRPATSPVATPRP